MEPSEPVVAGARARSPSAGVLPSAALYWTMRRFPERAMTCVTRPMRRTGDVLK
jgi:hypothetical protein